MKPTVEQVTEVVAAWAELIPFFPKGAVAQKIIAAEVSSFVGTTEDLRWFGKMVVRKITKWEGLPQLRAAYCSGRMPADGIPAVSDAPGFTAEQLEAEHLKREMEENERRLAEYRRLALAAPEEDRKPFQLPEARSL